MGRGVWSLLLLPVPASPLQRHLILHLHQTQTRTYLTKYAGNASQDGFASQKQLLCLAPGEGRKQLNTVQTCFPSGRHDALYDVHCAMLFR